MITRFPNTIKKIWVQKLVKIVIHVKVLLTAASVYEEHNEEKKKAVIRGEGIAVLPDKMPFEEEEKYIINQENYGKRWFAPPPLFPPYSHNILLPPVTTFSRSVDTTCEKYICT